MEAIVDQSIEGPENLEQNFHQATTIWLGGNEGSEVKSIINGKGAAVNQNNRKATWQCLCFQMQIEVYSFSKIDSLV